MTTGWPSSGRSSGLASALDDFAQGNADTIQVGAWRLFKSRINGRAKLDPVFKVKVVCGAYVISSRPAANPRCACAGAELTRGYFPAVAERRFHSGEVGAPCLPGGGSSAEREVPSFVDEAVVVNSGKAG